MRQDPRLETSQQSLYTPQRRGMMSIPSRAVPDTMATVGTFSRKRRRLCHGRNNPCGSRVTTTFKRQRSWLFGAALLASWCFSAADAHTLRIRVQPGRAFGGEAFVEQPQVEILEGDGGDVDVLFEVNAKQLQLTRTVR